MIVSRNKAVEKVLLNNSIKISEATHKEKNLAENALDRCDGVISKASKELCAMLGGRAFWGPVK